MVVLPWAKYEYPKLSTVLCNNSDIFQKKMSELMADLEFCRKYIDDILIISRENYDWHLEHLEQALTWLSEAGPKNIVSKSVVCR